MRAIRRERLERSRRFDGYAGTRLKRDPGPEQRRAHTVRSGVRMKLRERISGGSAPRQFRGNRARECKNVHFLGTQQRPLRRTVYL
jgi:hypothetical protein